MKFLNLIALAAVLFSCDNEGGKAKLETRMDSVSYAYGVAMFADVQRSLSDQIKHDKCLIGMKDQKAETAKFDDLQADAILRNYMTFGRDRTYESSASGTEELAHLLDSASYVVGMFLGQSLSFREFKEVNLELVEKALNDLNSESGPVISAESADSVMRQYMQIARLEIGKENTQIGRDFLAENQNREGVIVTDSGLQYEILEEGEGPSPQAQDTVTVYYRGTFINGEVFDETQPGTPATFRLDQVVKGWTEALQLMKVGSKYKLYVPGDIGFGEAGYGSDILPNETLIFEVELLDF